jgi:hypothetical protein
MHSSSCLGRFDISGDKRARSLVGDALSQAGAVIHDFDGDFVVLLAHSERDFAGSVPRLAPRFTPLDAMIERIARESRAAD